MIMRDKILERRIKVSVISVILLISLVTISSATLTLTDTSITESGDHLTLSANENVNITSGAIFSGNVIEGCDSSYPMVRIGHHGVWDSPAVFFDDTFTGWGIDLLTETDTFRIFKPANAIFTLTDSLAIIDVDLDVTGNTNVTGNIGMDGIMVMGADGFRVRPAVGGNDWFNVTIGGDIYTQGTWTNDGNIRQADSYWLYNTIGLLYPHVHMGEDGIEVYDGTVGENVVVNLTNAGDIIASGNVTADNVWIPAYAFAHSQSNITVDSAGVWYNVTFNESASFNQSVLHNHADSTNDTFTIVETGIYDLHGHLSFQDSTATPDSNVVFRFAKNDEEIAGSIREYDLDKKDWDTLGSTTVFVSLTAGDEIKLQFTSDDTTVSLESDNTYGVHKDTAVIKIKRVA